MRSETSGFVGEQFDAGAAQLVKHDATGHFRRADEDESSSRSGRKTTRFDELAHHEGRRNHLERQVEHIERVSQQTSVIVLFKFKVDILRRQILVDCYARRSRRVLTPKRSA